MIKPSIKEIVIVEGKTDTKKLQSLFNVQTIETNGSYLSKQTISLIKQVANKQGVILFLDPDGPGESIRRKLENTLTNFKQAFIIKNKCAKKIGVAEATNQQIINALKEISTFSKSKETLSWEEYVSLDLNTKIKRKKLADMLMISESNNKQLFKRLNMLQLTLKNIKEL
ncbi:MAG: ribonuclease M5 [Mycoplasmataceae bacterium]|jgi:ribonuclease M5|nr:ribonuclease M5 [Mycoplasmataceae bacterium]